MASTSLPLKSELISGAGPALASSQTSGGLELRQTLTRLPLGAPS